MICQICNNFNSESFLSFTTHLTRRHKISSKLYYDQYLKKINDGFCEICLTPTKYNTLRLGYFKYCSAKCSNNSSDVQEKKRQKNIQNCGFDNPSKSKEIQDKKIHTSRDHYGTDHPMQSKNIQEKSSLTNLEVRGVEYARSEERR